VVVLGVPQKLVYLNYSMLVEINKNKKHIYFENSEDFLTCIIDGDECEIEFEKSTGENLSSATTLYKGKLKDLPLEFSNLFEL